jgi:7-cyano-7-deazaguanine synthase
VFLSLPMAWAEVVGAEAIVIGVNALGLSGYPDCRPEYLRAFERVAALATKAASKGGADASSRRCSSCRRRTSSAAAWRSAWTTADAELLRSVGRGRPCGRCDSCSLRARGFARPERAIRCELGLRFRRKMTIMTERLYYTIPTFASSTRR